jgi:hypothetical protein
MDNPFGTYVPKPHPLKVMLKQRGISQVTAANFCGVSWKYLNDVLNSRVPMTQEMDRKLKEVERMLLEGR